MRNFIDIVKYRKWWMALSVIILLPCIVAMIYSSIIYPTHAPLKVGIDYTGGTILQYAVKNEVSSEQLAQTRTTLENNGVTTPDLQIIHVNPTAENNNTKAIISIRTKFAGEDSNKTQKITNLIAKDYKEANLVQVSSIGPTLGNELFKNSLVALSLAVLGIIGYLTIRFKFDYALAAILGIVHDVIFVVGVFSILGLLYNVQIDGLFITALLTVVGFSVHDTIVVFDRIRENLRYYSKKMSFGEIVNYSVNQTFARSINTSLTTLITLLALYFFGGVTTKDFVLTMILGIAIGTYSSIFFCSMLVDIWREKKPATVNA